MKTIAILILAAGASRRMGGTDKLLQEVRGMPLLRDRALAALATGHPVYVALPPNHEKRRAVLRGLPVIPIEIADAAEGMAASLRQGIAPLQEFAGVVVMLADMPDITSEDISHIISAFDADADVNIWRGVADDGTSGHPVLLPHWVLEHLSRLAGDQGAREVLAGFSDRLRLCPLPGRHALTDLDTPEDWAEWTADTSSS